MYESRVSSEYTNSARVRFTRSALLDSPLHINFFRTTLMAKCLNRVS